MKSVLISIQPKWYEFIASGEKTVYVRKTAPKEEPFKAYIYQTKKKWTYRLLKKLGLYRGKVIGEFVCDRVEKIEPCFEYYSDGYEIDDDMLTEMCLTREELMNYGKSKTLYGWHISDLKLYDKPKELEEFKKYNRTCKYSNLGLSIPKCKICPMCNLTTAPQSWCYAEE